MNGGQLVIWVDNTDIVRFKVLAPDGRTLTEPDDRPSSHSRWLICSDNQDRVWLYSGDIGTVVWIPAGGAYERHNVNSEELIAQIPEAMFRQLRESYQSRWKSVRKPP